MTSKSTSNSITSEFSRNSEFEFLLQKFGENGCVDTDGVSSTESEAERTFQNCTARKFLSAVVTVLLAGIYLTFGATILEKVSPIVGSGSAFLVVMVLREWNRIYGNLLTRTPRASINYRSIMSRQKKYIPLYDMEWLCGKQPEPYLFDCSGPELNPDIDDRTPNNDESRSPPSTRARTILKQ